MGKVIIIVFVFVILGFLFVFPLIVLGHTEGKKKKLRDQWLRQHELRITAEFKYIQSDLSDESRYRLVCVSSGGEKFHSDWLKSDPTPFMAPYKTFVIIVNPKNHEDYIFDVSWQLMQFVS
jgi:hypothetical protein